jgi:antitoxin component of MazEF toxin-antitoxin module
MFNMKPPAPVFPDDEPIGRGRIDLSTQPPDLPPANLGMPPIKTHILKIGNSAAAVIPVQVLKQRGFDIGDYITITIQRRKPEPNEIARDERREKKVAKCSTSTPQS